MKITAHMPTFHGITSVECPEATFVPGTDPPAYVRKLTIQCKEWNDTTVVFELRLFSSTPEALKF